MENRTEYLSNFSGYKQEEALKNALDIRKFEIEMYWKRAAYFWAFIALAFTAYFAVLVNGEKITDVQEDLLLLSSGAGFFMSLCWYCVGKGSKYWQENWEKHVDWLENNVMGPLYKRVLAYKHGKVSIICPTKPYPFSVSKINQLLTFAICLVWVFLYGASFWKIVHGKSWVKAIAITTLLVGLIIILLCDCKTNCYKDCESDEDKMHIRGDTTIGDDTTQGHGQE
jgi:hypothetical protein